MLRRQVSLLKNKYERITATKVANMNPEIEVSKKIIQRFLKSFGGSYKKQPQLPPLTKKIKEEKSRSLLELVHQAYTIF